MAQNFSKRAATGMLFALGRDATGARARVMLTIPLQIFSPKLLRYTSAIR